MAGTTARDLPGVSDLLEPNVREPVSRLTEEMRRLLGFRGDRLDMAITYRAAVARGWVDGPPTSSGGGGGGAPGGGGGGPPDLTPPPDPTGLTGSAGFSRVIVQWAAPVYTQGGGHGQTNIYAVQRALPSVLPPPVFADAARVSGVYGTSTITALPSELNTRWHIWIKWQSVAGVESVNPAGGVNGFQLDTGQDISQLLTILTGQITSGQLDTALNTEISLISGPSSLSGSVAARVLAEATARGAAISAEATTRSSADSALAANITSLAATVSTNNSTLTAAITSEASTRASADGALAADITTLFASAGANSAAISAEATARAALDGSLQALYTLRVQTTAGGRTVVGGFGLSATSTAAGGSEIEFGVRADRFYIGAPSGATGVGDVLPFVVQTNDQTVNGVLIPRGVYMDAAYIKNLSALVARLGTAWIDDAMVANLSAAKITAGVMDAARINAGTITANLFQANLFQTDNVLTRGLTVRDNSGAIILAAGTPLNHANITPSSGWLNSAVTINADGTLSGAGGGAVTAAGISAIQTSLGNAPGGILNSNISITAGGTLSGAGGGSVTLTGLGAGAMALINQITSANVSTYIGSAAIGLANINTASITNLSALSSFLGTVDIAIGGYLRSGQTAWSTGSGFWQGWIGSGPGEPGWSIGDSTAYLRYRPSTGLEQKLNAFGISISPSSISSTATTSGSESHGTATASATGGLAPIVYSWMITSQSNDPSGSSGQMFISGGGSTATVGVASVGQSDNSIINSVFQCTAIDANGRISVNSISVQVTRGTPP